MLEAKDTRSTPQPSPNTAPAASVSTAMPGTASVASNRYRPKKLVRNCHGDSWCQASSAACCALSEARALASSGASHHHKATRHASASSKPTRQPGVQRPCGARRPLWGVGWRVSVMAYFWRRLRRRLGKSPHAPHQAGHQRHAAQGGKAIGQGRKVVRPHAGGGKKRQSFGALGQAA